MTQGNTPCLTLCIFQQLVPHYDHSSPCPQHLTLTLLLAVRKQSRAARTLDSGTVGPWSLISAARDGQNPCPQMCLTSTFSDSAISGSAPHRRLTHCIIDQHVTLHTWTVHRLFVHCHCNTSLQCTPVHLTCIFDQRTASLYTVTAIPNCSAPQYIYSAPQCNYSALNYSASHRAPHSALHRTLHSALHIAHNRCMQYNIPVHITTSITIHHKHN